LSEPSEAAAHARLASINDLFVYTIWADRTLLSALRAVAGEDLTRDTGSSFPSLLATMGHILAAERVWLSRFVGSPLHLPSLSEYADLAALERAFEEYWPQLEAYLASLRPQDLDRELTWTNTLGVTRTLALWGLLLHFVNHATYHRGQLVTMLRQLGYPAPGTDLVYYLADRGDA
jgi:uncharacterized damage-inducible protein DinB